MAGTRNGCRIYWHQDGVIYVSGYLRELIRISFISKFRELQEQKEKLDWIDTGLFKDVSEMTECYTFFNQEVLKFRGF